MPIFMDLHIAPGATAKEIIAVHQLDLEVQDEYQRLLIDLKLRNPEYAAMVDIEPLPTSEIQKLVISREILKDG